MSDPGIDPACVCCNPNHNEPVTPRENTIRGGAVLFKQPDKYKEHRT